MGLLTEYTIDDLVPNRKYKFLITNYNAIGYRDPSEPIAVVTLEDGNLTTDILYLIIENLV